MEVIVKYNGDIYSAAEAVDALAEPLYSNYAILTLDFDKIDTLKLLPQIEYIELPKNLSLMVDLGQKASCINEVKNQNEYALTGKGVIVAVIDSGIDYTHSDFRNKDGTTRILYIWDQTIEGMPPKGFLGGSEFNSQMINDALFSDNPNSLGVTDFFNHGTHVCRLKYKNFNFLFYNLLLNDIISIKFYYTVDVVKYYRDVTCIIE